MKNLPLLPLCVSVILCIPACRERPAAEASSGGKTKHSRFAGNPAEERAVSATASNSEKDPDRDGYELRKKEFKASMDLANKAFRKSDIPGCMAALDDAESKLENRSELHNLRGSCFVELRDFGKAREAFQKADQMSPGNSSIAFNLAEMDFLTGRWQVAISRFEVVAEKFAGKENGIGELAEFKIMLCHSQLGQIVQMEGVLAKFRKNPHSPAGYYSEAAATLLKGDIPGFENWCAKAREAFPDKKVLAPWQDTMNEYLLASKP